VSYTNVLHDHNLPLGPHSIPTRISTRPISFTSPEHSAKDDLRSSNDDSEPVAPSSQWSPEKSSLSPINHADREMFLNGPGLSSSSVKENSTLNDEGQTDVLEIYTTRPSTESTRDGLSHGSRSNSVSETRNGLPAAHHRFGLSASLSVERGHDSKLHGLQHGFKGRKIGISSRDIGSLRAPNPIIDSDFSLTYLSHVANFFARNVPRGTKIKASVEYPLSFTGREAVTTITHCLNRINPSTKSTTQATLNRRLALTLTRRLLSEHFFHEVTNLNSEAVLNDNIDEVYVFPSTQESKENLWEKGQENLPQGVMTNLSGCYSFGCRMDRDRDFKGCYSYDCPNRKSIDSALKRTTSATTSTITNEPSQAPAVVQTKDWASVVPKELLTTLDSKEIARQSIIYEVISGEQDYVKDLDDYEALFIIPLKQASPPILPPKRLDLFLEKVVSNVLEVRGHNRVMLQNLLARQHDQHPIVKGIGDVVLNSALEWGSDYIRYTSDHVFGEVEVNEEKGRNPMFAQLLNSIPKQSSRRADFKHYHSRAFVRLQRYILLLESLLRKTPEGHEDRGGIENAMEVIRRQCLDADQAVNIQQAKLQLFKLNKEIVCKSDTPDLQLLDPCRQLIMCGKMVRKPDGGTGLSEWNELHVMLFDHYLVLTKVKRLDENNVKYHIARPPIMLELARVTGFNEPCERRPRGLRNIAGTLGGHPGALERGNSDPYSNQPIQGGTTNNLGPTGSNTQDDRSLYPITIHSIGRNNYSVTMYVDSDRVRQMWKTKLEEAIGVRMQILENSKVFDLCPMTDQTFAATGSTILHSNGHQSHGSGSYSGVTNGNATQNNSNSGHSVGESMTNMHGPPTCSVPFRSTDGKRLVAVGCMDGLWIGLRKDPSSMRQVIHIKSITQCAVLQEFGFLLVLAEKILLAYPLESLVPSRAGQALQPPAGNAMKTTGSGAIASRLSGNKDVLFFRCGRVGPRTLVIYVKKGGVNQTVFKALEPVKNVEKSKTTSSRGFFGLSGQKSESFRGYKEFFVPSESYGIQYLRSTLAIHCARGFEIMNLDTLKTASIPDFNQIKQHDSRLIALQRRCDENRPLGMFRIGEQEFLLCYDEFAFFADKHGDPLVDRYDSIMEWDGKPISVAYSAPYVICFSNMMIEVWNTLNSKRVQIIVGQAISCTYDGGSPGDESKLDANGMTDDGERRIHVMMKDSDKFYRVFEMVPL
ncbi:CNH domain-containing protein, partial [Phakopsora pachyrhizi]